MVYDTNDANFMQIYRNANIRIFAAFAFIRRLVSCFYEKRYSPVVEPSVHYGASIQNIMKKNIHPQYFPNATVKCACGNTFTVGSTKEFIEIEICSKCHPFYTGKEKIVDKMGRVEKFRKRLAKKK